MTTTATDWNPTSAVFVAWQSKADVPECFAKFWPQDDGDFVAFVGRDVVFADEDTVGKMFGSSTCWEFEVDGGKVFAGCH